VTTTTRNELKSCYGCVKDVPKIIHGLSSYYDYVTNLLRLCDDIAGSDTVKLRLHYVVNGIHTVVQRFCDGLYDYDMVWSAKRIIHFTPAEQLSVIMMSTKRQLVLKLTEEEGDFLFTAAYFQWQIMKN